MAINPIVECLKEITDYDNFETFCVDLLQQDGYPQIRKIGGSGDRGCDAIEVDPDDPDKKTIFCFSVNKKWKQKLKQDANRIIEMGHNPTKVVFVNISRIKNYYDIEKEYERKYNWKCQIYDQEAIRALLVGKLYHLLGNYESFFPKYKIKGIQKPNNSLCLTNEESRKEIEKASFLPIVMAGGLGTRVIHLSPTHIPKQFWRLYGRDSMLQDIVRRLTTYKVQNTKALNPIILSVKDIKKQITEQIEEQNGKEIIDLWFEPDRKGTTAAIAYATKKALEEGLISEYSVIGFFPADQYIFDQEFEGKDIGKKSAELSFHNTVDKAIKVAREKDAIVLIGSPARKGKSEPNPKSNPGLNYGWINVDSKDKNDNIKVIQFEEKPNEDEIVKKLDSDKNYFWNSGSFFARAKVFIDSISRFNPKIVKNFGLSKNQKSSISITNINYNDIETEMFDKAVLEKIVDDEDSYISVHAIQSSYEWEDLGNENSIVEHFIRRKNFPKTLNNLNEEDLGEVQIQFKNFNDSEKIYVVHEHEGDIQIAQLGEANVLKIP